MFQEQSSRLMGRFGMEGNDGRDTLNPGVIGVGKRRNQGILGDRTIGEGC